MNKWDQRLTVKAIYILITICFFFLVKVYLGSMYCGFLVPLDASHNTVYCVHKYEYILCIKVKVYNLKIILSI